MPGSNTSTDIEGKPDQPSRPPQKVPNRNRPRDCECAYSAVIIGIGPCLHRHIRGELVTRGIRPNHARRAAMFHLAAEMLIPVLAELLGLAPTTAGRWAALSAGTWARYTAMRRTSGTAS